MLWCWVIWVHCHGVNILKGKSVTFELLDPNSWELIEHVLQEYLLLQFHSLNFALRAMHTTKGDCMHVCVCVCVCVCACVCARVSICGIHLQDLKSKHSNFGSSFRMIIVGAVQNIIKIDVTTLRSSMRQLNFPRCPLSVFQSHGANSENVIS